MTPLDLGGLSRAEFARLVALLARQFGSNRLQHAEDAVQDAFAAAVRLWGTQGEPADPRAWLYRAARNRLIDQLRRRGPDPIDPDAAAAPTADPDGSGDAELRLILLCCHPALTPESQVALTLKVAAGFSVAEIGRLLRAGDDAVDQRLVRAKRALRAAGADFEIGASEMARRAVTAREVLYGMFSEGYASVTAESGLRPELCFEALRLAQVMLSDPSTRTPDGEALAALFAFQASRLASRHDDEGEFLSLRDQNRQRWDRTLIAAGLEHLRRSMGSELTRYHVEAEIASCHATAARYPETDWGRIVALYDLLLSRWPTPAAWLSRAVAIGERDGPDAGLAALDALAEGADLEWAYHAAAADLASRLGQTDRALRHAQRGRALGRAPGVQRHFDRLCLDLAPGGAARPAPPGHVGNGPDDPS